MKTTEKIDHYYRLIESIDYNNKEGGKYAYVQFLSLTREVLILLQPVKKIEREVRAIESINWVFNEYLTTKFSEQQRVIFDMKRRELRTIIDGLRESLTTLETKEHDSSRFLEVQTMNAFNPAGL
jgi:hypothetical protein